MTTFSPYTVGRVETRRSMALPSTVSPMRPSWGMRRSAMSISAMTLRRDTTPGMIERGWRMRSCNTPSMRKRMRRSTSVGSTWMSEARSCTAWRITRFTNLTIGASSVTARSPARSGTASITSSATIWATEWTSSSSLDDWSSTSES